MYVCVIYLEISESVSSIWLHTTTGLFIKNQTYAGIHAQVWEGQLGTYHSSAQSVFVCVCVMSVDQFVFLCSLWEKADKTQQGLKEAVLSPVRKPGR